MTVRGRPERKKQIKVNFRGTWFDVDLSARRRRWRSVVDEVLSRASHPGPAELYEICVAGNKVPLDWLATTAESRVLMRPLPN